MGRYTNKYSYGGVDAKKIYGSYSSNHEARDAVKELLDKGYEKEQITVVAKEDLDEDLEYMESNKDDKKSIWDSIKDTFTFDRYEEGFWNNYQENEERNSLKEYKSKLDSGNIVVLIEEKTTDNTVNDRNLNQPTFDRDEYVDYMGSDIDHDKERNERLKNKNTHRP
ncbi:general stress protein [Senegalia sp. (in: firmicutes)]|uniref:general stress protein n=1 Tax=Senegalia sp. (in: firmicutes) TaxID=1924098 RepID=UPI003F967AF2